MEKRASCYLSAITLFVVAIALRGNVDAIAAPDDTTPSPIYANALSPGDTILFVAPAKYLNKGRVAHAKRRLEELGFNVRTPDNLFRRKGFLAGSDEERAAELMAAFADPDVDAIFPGTGGYGSTRIVDKLDYDVIRRNPKILVGFSDITALHIAINQRTGLVTFHSPNPLFGLGSEKNLSPFGAHWFWRALLAKNYCEPLGNPRRAGSSPTPVGYTIHTTARDTGASDEASIYDGVPSPVTITPGTARGRLIGGNLSVLHALMGTPFEIQTKDKILFLEDVGEAPYRVDRMLSTLRLAGKLDHVAGVILGHFIARDDEDEWDDDASMDDVLRDYFANLGVPVVIHFPVGHVRFNATLPIGALAEFDATHHSLRVLENPASP